MQDHLNDCIIVSIPQYQINPYKENPHLTEGKKTSKGSRRKRVTFPYNMRDTEDMCQCLIPNRQIKIRLEVE